MLKALYACTVVAKIIRTPGIFKRFQLFLLNWPSIVHSKESLWLELRKAWDNVSVDVLRKYIDTMPERCAAVIAAKGGHTKY